MTETNTVKYKFVITLCCNTFKQNLNINIKSHLIEFVQLYLSFTLMSNDKVILHKFIYFIKRIIIQLKNIIKFNN